MDLTRGIALSFIFFISSVFAQDVTKLFNSGNQYYQQGEYQAAIDQYEQVLTDGYESGELYFNLGNAYYKLGMLGKARINYERAVSFIEGEEALDENLRILKMRLVDQIEPPPRFFLNVWWDFTVNYFSMHVLMWIISGLFWLLIASLIYHIYHKTRARQYRGKSILVTVLTIFIIFTLISVQKVYNLETERFAVIMKPSVTLRAEPKAGGTEVFVLHEGTKVKIEREIQDWFEIKLIDGKTGWLDKENLEEI